VDIRDTLSYQESDPLCLQLTAWKAAPGSVPAKRIGFYRSFNKDTEGVWRRKQAVVIPAALRLDYLQHFHDRNDHGHMGVFKIHEVRQDLKIASAWEFASIGSISPICRDRRTDSIVC
jgi:hypothetical protein